MRVLIVDDDPIQVELLSIILRNTGYTVLLAGNGQEAVRIVGDEERIDLITMDAVMPIVDGITATKRLKGCPDTAQIPILGVTALPSARESMLDAGANAVILKPFTTKDLLATIWEILRDQES